MEPAVELDMAKDYRLVAMDLRGHGLSDKPREGYTESKLWADDVNAAIQALRLDHPILCGWSYGPLVILDYIRHYGEGDISGINFIGGVTKLGSDEAASVLTPEFLSLIPGFLSTEVEESVRTLRSLLGLCFARVPSAEEQSSCSDTTCPFRRMCVRDCSPALFDNDDLLPRIRKPVLITHGAKDGVVKLTAVDQHKAGMAHAQVQVVANAGHGPFWDDAAAFNQGLRKFSEGL